jgi:hypothetical protein
MEAVKGRGRVGALLRRDFRRLLMRLDISYTEDRGWLDSYFVFQGSADKMRQLQLIWARMKAQIDP